ncbi:MAG: glycosyltransferase [Treponema sp.]|nr:glycosyltransferase [Treponema sp.]
MKVAIVHDWLVTFGGAERVVQRMCTIYPEADIYTLVYDEKKMNRFFPKKKIHTSWIQRIPFATRLYTKLLKYMPGAFESFDLSGYDLVLASSSCCAKGVITAPNVPLVAYIHSPMRYAWDLYFDYRNRSSKLTQFFMARWMPNIREWDYISSQRIDTVLANSAYIARRIYKFWKRESTVLYPPVDTERLKPNGLPAQDFYVVFSRFVPYKRIDLAISACGTLNRKLVVIGAGSQEKELKALASSFKGAQIIFTGRISDEAVQDYLQRCRALIFCAEEDFGIIPVEAQACGRPVVAFGKGGAKETVLEGKTGVFFDAQTPESLTQALLRFEELEASKAFDATAIAAHAGTFSTTRFDSAFKRIVSEAMHHADIGRTAREDTP